MVFLLQEAVLSSWLQFSDGSLTPLDIYDPTHFRLTVTSLDEGVISIKDSPLTVVAEGEGQGTLVRAEMTICEVCQKYKRKSTLAVGTGSATVKFQSNSKRPENGSVNVINNVTTAGNVGPSPSGIVNSSDSGKEEVVDTEKNQEQPEQVPSRSSESEREESALTKITTTAQDSTAGSIANDLGMGRADDASAGVSKPGNIVNSGDVLSTGKADGGARTSWNTNEVPEISMVSTGKASGNLVNFPPKDQKRPNNDYGDDEDDGIDGPLRPLTDLEIGMYALLGVFCLAIVVFLINCVSYLVKFRHKHTPPQVSEHPGHRHDWVWLGTDAELVMNVTGSPLQRDTHDTAVIDIAPSTEPVGTLTRRTSCQVSSVSNDSGVGSVGSLRAKPIRRDSLHSPTSKRKRVQFTTFTSLDRQNSPKTLPLENGHGINWVGKEEHCSPPEVPAVESFEQL